MEIHRVAVIGSGQMGTGVAQVWPSGQKDWWGKFRQKMIRQIKVEVEASKVAIFLFFDLIDLKLGKDHTSFWVIRMR